MWKAAVLTAMMPLGLAACYGEPTETKPPAKPSVTETKLDVQGATPAQPEGVELDSAVPDPSGHDPVEPAPVDAGGGDSSTPEGTDTPIVEVARPAKKYGAPPRPKPKYGGPPRPRPEPSKPTLPPKPAPGD